MDGNVCVDPDVIAYGVSKWARPPPTLEKPDVDAPGGVAFAFAGRGGCCSGDVGMLLTAE